MFFEGERVATSKGARWINQSPSREVATLADKIDNFYARYNAFICDLMPINMIGSMLVAETPEQMGMGDEPAVVLAEDIPLLVRVPPDFKDEPEHIILPHVLVKNACGRNNTGVVLTGPLAGLIVDDRFTGRPYKEGMNALRIWNDDCLNPLIDRLGERMFFIDGPQQIREKLIGVYERRVSSYETLEFTSDFFFRLCREQGYPVDRGAFHFTRTLEYSKPSA